MQNTIPLLTLGIRNPDAHDFEPCHLGPVSNNYSKDIRSVSCGGTCFVVRLWPKHHTTLMEEDLFVKFSSSICYSEYFNQCVNNQDFYLLNYKLGMEMMELGNYYQVENVYSNLEFIILQMKNNLILTFETSIGYSNSCKKFMDDGIEIREIVCGPSSSHMIVYGNDSMIYYFRTTSNGIIEQVDLRLDFTDKKYVTSALSGYSTFVVYEKEDGSHHILTHGDDTFSVQNGQISKDRFSEMDTPFKGERIKQMKCGIFHTCIILENGQVYTCGFNLYSQCGFDYNFIEKFLTKLNFPSFPLQPLNDSVSPIVYEGNLSSNHVFKPKSILCGGSSTTFVNEFGFLGIGGFNFGRKYKFNSEPQECWYYSFGRASPQSYEMSVDCGSSYYVIYNRKIASKCLVYFNENLKIISGATTCHYFADLKLTVIN